MAVFCRFLWYNDPNRIGWIPPHTSILMVYLMVSSRSSDWRYQHGFAAIAIKNAKSRAKSYKLTDCDGLYLLITPGGARYWRMN